MSMDLISDEILIHIFSFFDIKSNINTQICCKKFYGLLNDNTLWNYLFNNYCSPLKKVKIHFENKNNILINKCIDWKSHWKKYKSDISFYIDRKLFYSIVFTDPKGKYNIMGDYLVKDNNDINRTNILSIAFDEYIKINQISITDIINKSFGIELDLTTHNCMHTPYIGTITVNERTNGEIFYHILVDHDWNQYIDDGGDFFDDDFNDE